MGNEPGKFTGSLTEQEICHLSDQTKEYIKELNEARASGDLRESTARIRSAEDYKGEVMNGRAHGEGVWQGTNGSIYKGTFKTMPHGFCIETTKSGTRIEGERNDGALHGNLTYYKVNGPVTNEVWMNNERVMS